MKKAFTLAEVLITLGIIGVIAAMTMPSLMTKINKAQYEAKLKQNYSLLQQVLKLAEANDAAVDSIPDSLEGIKFWFETYIAPHLKYTAVCYDEKGCWASGDTKTLTGSVVPWNTHDIGIGVGIVTVKLANGANLCIDGAMAGDLENQFGIKVDTESSLIIYIDVNGDRHPNQVGKDIYIVGWKESSLVPAGEDVSISVLDSNCSRYSSHYNAGYYCMKKIMKDAWKIPDVI